MFLGFHAMLRRAGLKVGLTEWLALMQAFDTDQIQPSLRSFYTVARALVCRDEGDFDKFDLAFAAFFKDAELPEQLRKDLLEWLNQPIKRPVLDPEELAKLKSMSREELQKLFEERLKEQTERHDGGNYWIGTGGTSPFGQGGAHPSGMRVGEGATGRGTAVAGARARRFRNYRADRILDTRSLAVAIRRLRRLERRSRRVELDIDETIRKTAENAGDLEIIERPERRNQARVVLLMDTGGSMEPHTKLVESFFSALKQSGGLRDVESYFFHNCVYNVVYSDIARFKEVEIEKLTRSVPPNTHLFVVGDAWMGPYEMFASHGSIEMATSDEMPGIGRLEQLSKAYAKRVWLNPIPDNYWHAETIAAAASLFPMFPMTLDGIVEAVGSLLGRRSKKRHASRPMWDADTRL